MVMTKPELIGSLQHEVHILLHLASKVDRAKLDYRPTKKQRSTLEWLQYLSIMGPALVEATKAGGFDAEKWTAAQEAAKKRNFEQTVEALETLKDFYATHVGAIPEADLRSEIEMFGNKTTKGGVLVNLVLCGHAAYRTQIFNHLKACGREELSTMNLWAGCDAP